MHIEKYPEIIRILLEITDPVNQVLIKAVPSDLAKAIICRLFFVYGTFLWLVYIYKRVEREEFVREYKDAKTKLKNAKTEDEKERMKILIKKKRKNIPRLFTKWTITFTVILVTPMYASVIYVLYGYVR